MKKNLYFNEREHAFIDTMPKGWCRQVIQREMWEILGHRDAVGKVGDAIEAGKMIDETLLKIEGVEVDSLEGRDFQNAVIGENDAERKKDR